MAKVGIDQTKDKGAALTEKTYSISKVISTKLDM